MLPTASEYLLAKEEKEKVIPPMQNIANKLNDDEVFIFVNANSTGDLVSEAFVYGTAPAVLDIKTYPMLK